MFLHVELGIIVTRVAPRSSAAGILEPGDVIQEVGGVEVRL